MNLFVIELFDFDLNFTTNITNLIDLVSRYVLY